MSRFLASEGLAREKCEDEHADLALLLILGASWNNQLPLAKVTSVTSDRSPRRTEHPETIGHRLLK